MSSPSGSGGSLRVRRHPVLPDDGEPDITIFFDGRELPAKRGEPIAAALLAAGVRVFRTTPRRGYPRGIYCGIGRCTDCVMVVDGEPNVRTCVTPVRPGMRVETQRGLGNWDAES
jgi:predicted molibdopterin-dependent oxidoreductase YjgC